MPNIPLQHIFVALLIIALVIGLLYLFFAIFVASFFNSLFSSFSPSKTGNDSTVTHISERISPYYYTDGNTVIYSRHTTAEKVMVGVLTLGLSLSGDRYRSHTLEGVDPSSVTVVSHNYIMTDTTVFYRWHPLADADPQTFSILIDENNQHIAHDQKRLWYEERLLLTLETATFDPGSIEVLGTIPTPSRPLDNDVIIRHESGTTYYITAREAVALPEDAQTPVTAISTCRGWYEMNDYFWYQNTKVTQITPNYTVLNCINHTGGAQELVFYVNDKIYAANSASGNLETLYTLPGNIVEDWEFGPLGEGSILHLDTDELFAARTDTTRSPSMQFLTMRSNQSVATNTDDRGHIIRIGDELWINHNRTNEELEFQSVGVPKDESGNYQITSTNVLLSQYVLEGADPESFTASTKRNAGFDRKVCYDRWRYYGDRINVGPRISDDNNWDNNCKPTSDEISFLYDDLSISFQAIDATQMEPNTTTQEESEYLIGHVVIENTTVSEQIFPNAVYDSFFLEDRNRQRLALEMPMEYELGPEGFIIPPHTRIAWPLSVRVPHEIAEILIRIVFEHTPYKAKTYGESTYFSPYTTIRFPHVATYQN